jgi:peptide/nickel transport system substrate-binding protein
MDDNVRRIVSPGRKIPLAIVAVAAIGAAGCGSTGHTAAPSQSDGYAYGTLSAQSGTPKAGGTVNIAESPGAGPTYIFPVIPGSANSVYVMFQFQWQMFRPLYWYPTGANPAVNTTLSLASLPVYSNGDKTVTINLKPSYTWSNGAPVDANDLVFEIDLIKAAIKENPSDWAAYTPGQFPDNVLSATATSKYSVTLQLNRSYNPAWFTDNELTSLTPLPSTFWNKASATGKPLNYASPANATAIYNYLNGQSSAPATFATNPIWQDVDGPFRLKTFNASTDAYSMVPNQAYTGPQKAHIAELNALSFTSSTAEFNQLTSGQLTAGAVDPSDLSQVPALKAAGYNVYGLPSHGFNFIMLNFLDKTDDVNKILGQLYIRQALDHLIDEPAYIASKGIFDGAAAPNYSSVPTVAGSPYNIANGTTAPYPYSISAAVKLLTSHGWKVVPNGKTTCQSPGTGPADCGAGIPAGQAITFNLFYSDQTPVNAVQCTAFASAAAQIGVTVNTEPKTFSYLIQHFNDPAAAADDSSWAMEQWGGFSITPYPTANGTFNSTGSSNVGGYSSPEANTLIHNSVYGSDPMAVKSEGQFLSTNLPVLWLPSQDIIWAWSKDLSGPPDSFASLTQEAFTPEYWYFKN